MSHLHKSNNVLVRYVFAHSPRLICQKCGEMFLLGSMSTDVSLKGLKDHCPCCGEPGPFHTPSRQELLDKIPEAGKWLSYVAFPVAIAVLFAILGVAIIIAIRLFKG